MWNTRWDRADWWDRDKGVMTRRTGERGEYSMRQDTDRKQGRDVWARCVYVGETGRSLEIWLKEHRYTVKNMNSRNGIAMHACNNKHWEAAKVVAFEQHLTKTKVLESLHIRDLTHTSNLDSGYILSSIYLETLLSKKFSHSFIHLHLVFNFVSSVLSHLAHASLPCFWSVWPVRPVSCCIRLVLLFSLSSPPYLCLANPSCLALYFTLFCSLSPNITPGHHGLCLTI